MKKYLIAMAAFMALATTSCDWGDPEYDKTLEPPVVAVTPSTLSGVVTDLNGKAIKGATVNFGGESATTGDNGEYSFSGIKGGAQSLVVSAQGYFTKTLAIAVPDVTHATYALTGNAVLNAEVKQAIAVKANEDSEATVETQSMASNKEMGQVEVTVEVPAAAVSDADAVVYVSPICTEEDAVAASRANEEIMVTGAALSCNKPNATLAKAIAIDFKVDDSVKNLAHVKAFKNGKWVAVSSENTATGIRVMADSFTSYAVFVVVNMVNTHKTIDVKFSESNFDNRYGKSPLYVGEVTYSYNTGIQFNSKATNNLEGLLIEYIARNYGVSYMSNTGVYVVNDYISVGLGLKFVGTQSVNEITVSNTNVSASNYGEVKVSTVGYKRNHEGGGA